MGESCIVEWSMSPWHLVLKSYSCDCCQTSNIINESFHFSCNLIIWYIVVFQKCFFLSLIGLCTYLAFCRWPPPSFSSTSSSWSQSQSESYSRDCEQVVRILKLDLQENQLGEGCRLSLPISAMSFRQGSSVCVCVCVCPLLPILWHQSTQWGQSPPLLSSWKHGWGLLESSENNYKAHHFHKPRY